MLLFWRIQENYNSMGKISFYCSKKGTDTLKKRIETGYPEDCLRIVKIEDHPKNKSISKFTVEYYHPQVLICLGEDKMIANLRILE